MSVQCCTVYYECASRDNGNYRGDVCYSTVDLRAIMVTRATAITPARYGAAASRAVLS